MGWARPSARREAKRRRTRIALARPCMADSSRDGELWGESPLPAVSAVGDALLKLSDGAGSSASVTGVLGTIVGKAGDGAAAASTWAVPALMPAGRSSSCVMPACATVRRLASPFAVATRSGTERLVANGGRAAPCGACVPRRASGGASPPLRRRGTLTRMPRPRVTGRAPSSYCTSTCPSASPWPTTLPGYHFVPSATRGLGFKLRTVRRRTASAQTLRANPHLCLRQRSP